MKIIRKPCPALSSYEIQMQKWRYQFEDEETGEFPHPSLVQSITDLVFSGNREVALQLLNKACPEHRDGKDDFWRKYVEILNSSRFYSDFEALLEDKSIDHSNL